MPPVHPSNVPPALVPTSTAGVQPQRAGPPRPMGHALQRSSFTPLVNTRGTFVLLGLRVSRREDDPIAPCPLRFVKGDISSAQKEVRCFIRALRVEGSHTDADSH